MLHCCENYSFCVQCLSHGDTDKVAGISEIWSFEFTVKMSEFCW